MLLPSDIEKIPHMFIRSVQNCVVPSETGCESASEGILNRLMSKASGRRTIQRTRVSSLNPRPVRKSSNAPHHPVVLGIMWRNCIRANSRSFISTASVGWVGEEHMKPRAKSAWGAEVQEHIGNVIWTIPRDGQNDIEMRGR